MGGMAHRWLPDGPIRSQRRSGWVFVALVLVVAGPMTYGSFTPATGRTPALVASAALAVTLAYIYFVSPVIVVAEEAITVENPWRCHVVPWGSLIDVNTRFQLTLVTPQGEVHALAAPSPGGFSAMRAKPDADARTERIRRQSAGGIRAGDLPAQVSGQIAAVIRGHWQDRVEAGDLDHSEVATTTPRVVHLVITLGGLVVVAILWLVQLL